MYTEKEEGKDFKLEGIKNCKYYLPCGICDRTGDVCTQYSFSVTLSNNPPYTPYSLYYTNSEKKTKSNKTILNEGLCENNSKEEVYEDIHKGEVCRDESAGEFCVDSPYEEV